MYEVTIKTHHNILILGKYLDEQDLLCLLHVFSKLSTPDGEDIGIDISNLRGEKNDTD